MYIEYGNVWKIHDLLHKLQIFLKKIKRMNKPLCYGNIESLYIYQICEKVRQKMLQPYSLRYNFFANWAIYCMRWKIHRGFKLHQGNGNGMAKPPFVERKLGYFHSSNPDDGFMRELAKAYIRVPHQQNVNLCSWIVKIITMVVDGKSDK